MNEHLLQFTSFLGVVLLVIPGCGRGVVCTLFPSVPCLYLPVSSGVFVLRVASPAKCRSFSSLSSHVSVFALNLIYGGNVAQVAIYGALGGDTPGPDREHLMTIIKAGGGKVVSVAEGLRSRADLAIVQV